MKPIACRTVLTAHVRDVLETRHADNPPWKQRHIVAWERPSAPNEIAIKQLLQGYAALADGYNETFEDDGGIGRNGYFAEHALGILQAANAYLNMGGKSRLDSGAVHRLIAQLADASGVNRDEI